MGKYFTGYLQQSNTSYNEEQDPRRSVLSLFA